MHMLQKPSLSLIALFLQPSPFVKSYSKEIDLLFDTHRGEGIRSYIRCWTSTGRGANRSIAAPCQYEVQKYCKYQETEQTYEQRAVEKMPLTHGSLEVGVSEWEWSINFRSIQTKMIEWEVKPKHKRLSDSQKLKMLIMHSSD